MTSRRPSLIVLVLCLMAGLSPAGPATGQDSAGPDDVVATPGGVAEEDAGVVRFGGSGRLETAALLATAHGDPGTVVLATAADFPDALAGAFLGHPVLLTDADTLSGTTAEAIRQLGTQRVLVLGGPVAVSPAVDAQLADLDVQVERVAGPTRIDTAVAVATRSGTRVGLVDGQRTALLAAAGDFPDALVAGAVAAGASLPLLLTERDEVPAATLQALTDLDVERVLVVGGTAVVSAEVLASVRAAGIDVQRLSGPTRQETAAAVARHARETLGWAPRQVVLATGADFPDALAAGPVAGRRQAPILLTGGTAAADAVSGLLGCDVVGVLVAGGPAAVSDAEAEAVLAAAGTGDACPFSPRTSPAQAVVRVGEVHEVVMDVRAGDAPTGTAGRDAATPSRGARQAGSVVAGGPTVRFTVVPDTLSRAVATPLPADATEVPGFAGGGLEAVVPVGTDGTATLAFTSASPGLAVVQACVSGTDGEEVCQEVAVQFSARYTATIDEEAQGFVSIDEGRVCAAVRGAYDRPVILLQGPRGAEVQIDAPFGCTPGPTVLTRDAVDAAPADHAFVTGTTSPLSIIGNEYAEWSPQQAQPFVPGPATQANTELVATIGELNDVTAINFIDYGDRDVLFATGRFGLKSYDVTDPTAPVLLDVEEMPDFWENEDMAVDEERRLVVLARDPRAYGGSTDDGVAGVYLIDASDPADLTRIVFHELPAGHTATCVRSERPDGTIAACDYLWSGGPATGAHQPEDWGGRPVFVTDIRDPDRPFTSPMPLLTGQNDGVTDYAHDVQVDADGLAWVSSRGGVYGFHTVGRHVDPLTGEERVATPVDPVPFAGGTLAGEDTSSGVIHNSYRPVGAEADLGADLQASGFAEGELVYATDEAFTSACTSDGLFNIVSLEGSYAGEGFVSTPEAPFRLRTVGTWSPVAAGEPGPVPLCSAHYFDMSDGIIAYSWYGQGTRFLDVSDPTDPIQVAFHRPLVNLSFAPKFRGDVVFVADSVRGIDVIRLTEGAARASATRTQVAAPALPTITPQQVAAGVSGGPVDLAGRTWAADPAYGWSCWIPQ